MVASSLCSVNMCLLRAGHSAASHRNAASWKCRRAFHYSTTLPVRMGLQISQFSYKVSGPGLVLSEIIAVSTHGLDTMPPAPEGNSLAEDDFDMDEMQVADEGLCVIGLAHRKLRKPAELGGNQLANWLGNPASCMSVAWGNWWR